MPQNPKHQGPWARPALAKPPGLVPKAMVPGVASAHRWLRKCLEQSLFAGPLLGFLAQLYGYHLSRTAPLLPNPAIHATIKNFAYFHGHMRYAYYTTPHQSLIFWCLAGPACSWLVGIILMVCWKGMRLTHQRG